jgi:hypothetical protein
MDDSPREILTSSRTAASMGSLSAEEVSIFNEGMTAGSPETAGAVVARRFGVRVQVGER